MTLKNASSLVIVLFAADAACGKSRSGGAAGSAEPAASAQPAAAAGSGGAGAATGTTAGGQTATEAEDPQLARPDAEKLPAALKVEGLDPDALAVDLARRVLAGGDDAAAALLTALAESGIAIRDLPRGGTVVRPARAPAQGLAFDAGEALAIAIREGQGVALSFSELGAMIREVAAPAGTRDDVRVDHLLAESLREHASGTMPTLRFWARFIAALGRWGAQPYDLLDPADRLVEDGSALLDPVQLVLVLARLEGDARPAAGRGAAAPAAGGAAADGTACLRRPALPAKRTARAFAGGPPRVAAAGLAFETLDPAPARLRLAWAAPPEGGGGEGRSGCTLSGTEGTIMDAAAAAATTGFGSVLDAVLPDEVAARINFRLALANAALGIAKVFLGGAMLDVKIEFEDGGDELKRTKSASAPGEQKNLTAKVRINAHGLQWLNCFRIMLNMAGLDASFYNDGPIEGARVTWKLYDGGTTGAGRMGIVQFSGNPLTRTDSEGVAKIVLEGTKQKVDVLPDAPQVDKSARVGIELVLKDSSFYQDLVDAIGAAAGGPLGVAVSLLERMAPFGFAKTVKVIDWAKDYGVSWDGPEGVHIEGVVCNGPEGEWALEISGQSGGGMPVVFGGSINAEIGRGYTGSFAGTMDLTAQVAIQMPPFVTQFSGTVRFVPGREPKLKLTPNSVRADINGSAGIAGEMQVHWGQSFSPSSGGELPVVVGTFCEE
ncbi:MAG: hypothetical protein HY905_07510 [Deltaproteobacteria bacterium]|nr:hypothetical protein [Deltaproteobacteria bacterium]